MTTLINHSIGRYHIIEQLGQGGMATVYKAYDTRLEREVAIKIIRTDAFPPAMLDRVLKRFEREARSLARLSHPNIVKVHDFGEHEGAPYLVMELHSGGTLKQRLGQPMHYRQAAELLKPVAEALVYAHQHNILHRDVKPSNILLTEESIPILTDFGIAKLLEESEGYTLTGTGVGIGTPEYMAPEQGLGQPLDGRADVYALGVVLFELVTGRKPYMADTPVAVLLKQVNDPLPRPRDFAPALPEQAEQVLFKALAKKPEDRYPDMAAFTNALQKMLQLQQAPPISSPIPSPKPKSVSEPVTHDEIPTPTPKSAVPISQKMPKWVLPVGGSLLVVALLFGLLTQVIKPVLEARTVGKAAAQLQTVQAQETARGYALQTEEASQALAGVENMTPTVFGRTSSPAFTPTPKHGDTLQREQDGMKMVYVPAGVFEMGLKYGGYDQQPVHSVYLDSFWIDSTEVTNAMYAKCVADGACIPPDSKLSNSRSSYYSNTEYDNYPVIYVSWFDADAYCQWADSELPSEAQWEKAARGIDGRTYPWGYGIQKVRANYDNSDTTKVGSYPAGVSPYGAMDMIGNVWEWVADWYEATYYSTSPKENPTGPDSGVQRVLRGRAWSDVGGIVDDMSSALRNRYNPNDSNDNIGFRCARSLNSTSASTSTPTVLLTRNTNINQDLRIGSTMTRDEDGMEMVYVPAGEFRMGSNDGYSNEQPVHIVYLDAYWIDKTEVTNAMYANFLNINGNRIEGGASWIDSVNNAKRIQYNGEKWAPMSGFEHHPVVEVTWYGAQAYCLWVSAQLPTEAQWEKAARGTDERTYPWGEAYNINLANYSNNIGNTTPVGSYPYGKSPYYALDMSGNVWEWVADYYDPGAYLVSPKENSTGPISGDIRVLRGGSWFNNEDNMRTTYRGSGLPNGDGSRYGFRCAISDP